MSEVDTTPTTSSLNLPPSKTHPKKPSGDTTPTGEAKSQTPDSKTSVKDKLLGLVKKGGKGDAKSTDSAEAAQQSDAKVATSTTSPTHLAGAAAPPTGSANMTASQADLPHPRSTSPHESSTAASSQIFERNVQESTLSLDMASAVPAHIKTEDQIPPALEASSLAITDTHLGPEEVEIVTHAAHQPAATLIAESIPSAHPSESHLALSPQESQHEAGFSPSHHDGDETASNYATLDPNDVRRLSFISFADVVHAEHAESGSAQSLHHLPLSSATDLSQTQSPSLHRPISPTRSPLSTFSQPFSQDVTTPPTTASGPSSAKGVELSPARSLNASPSAGSPNFQGELSIETLGQALRKTASRDLSGFNRSPPSSAI